MPAAAGVTKPTLYYHFGSKEGLAQALLTPEERAAAKKRLGPAEPHVHERPVDHHAHTAERPDVGIAEREQAEVQPRGCPHLHGAGRANR